MAGVITCSIGIWGVVLGSGSSVITGDETLSAAALLLVGGIVTICVAGTGIVGACCMWRHLLVIVSSSLSSLSHALTHLFNT